MSEGPFCGAAGWVVCMCGRQHSCVGGCAPGLHSPHMHVHYSHVQLLPDDEAVKPVVMGIVQPMQLGTGLMGVPPGL